MTDQALRNHAFRVLDLVVQGTDETAKVYLLRLSTPQVEALREVLGDVCALIVDVLEERQVGEGP